MGKRFNPPPNWPQPPLNWDPTPNWRPDPTWGPPPTGWQLWIEDDEAPTHTAAGELPPQRIFISYRRSDCQSQANGLHDGLRFRLPSAKVYMDIDAIPPGVDFEEHIRAEIEVCDLVLVMIGDNWLDPRPGSGTRRIDEPGDFVRLEIESAFRSPRCTLIPVLVEGADMPRADDLPESIRKLARINAIELSDHRWTSDLARLSEHLESRRKESLRVATRQRPSQDSPRADSQLKSDPAPSPAPVPANATPGPEPWVAPPPFARARSSKVGWWMVAITFVTCGLGAFAPAIWAANQRPGDTRFRKRAFMIAAVTTIVSVVGVALLASSPTDSQDTPTGVRSDVGTSMILICLTVSTGLAIFAVVADSNRRKAETR